MTISCIIIDDEPIARKGIENYIQKIDFLQLLGSYSHPDKIDRELLSDVDLLFLDIRLHKTNGLDFYKGLKPDAPFAVVISAYADYTLDGFELNVADYLLKPVPFERFRQAVDKVKELKSLKQNNQAFYDAVDDYFFIKWDGKIQKISYDDITYIEGLSNYVVIHAAGKKYLSYLSLNALVEKLPATRFMRIHRSYLIAIDKIDAVKNHEVFIKGNGLPVSKSYRHDLMKMIESKMIRK